MKKKTIFLLLFFLAFLSFEINAQISSGGVPYSFENTLPKDIPTVKTPSFDVEARIAEDLEDDASNLPYRFGYPHYVNYTLENSGVWTDLPNGDRVWRLKINCPEALSINLKYSYFNVPHGAALFLYNEDRTNVAGAFTSRNNKPQLGNIFSTQLIKGDVTILEYYEPANVAGEGVIEISDIIHGYRNAWEGSALKSGSCNVDVVCPESAGWEDQIRSVVAIFSSGGFSICSGSLLNNTSLDCKPYILTAGHCGLGNAGTAISDIFVFNYQNSTCRPIGSAASGGAGDGSFADSVSGGTVRSVSSNGGVVGSDFCLVELSTEPPAAYNVFYAGWSRSNTASPSATAIHHPGVEEKRISFENDALTSTNYSSNAQNANNTHWRVIDWDLGTTEGGSSGSPLFDNNQRVIGQLSGGGAACGNNLSDWYGKMWYNWDQFGGGPTNSLQPWLDPAGTGAVTLDGTNAPCTATCTNAPNAPSNASPADGATNEPTNVTVSWTAPTGGDAPDSYFVQVATDLGFTNIVSTGSSTGTTYAATGLSLGTTYFWRVRGVNACGNGAWSSAWTFTTTSTLADCTTFAGGPYGTFDAPACASDCGTPQSATFQVWANEGYVIDGLTIGAEYTFEFCTGYNAAAWADGPANLTVAEYDVANSTVGTVTTTVTGCTVTFTATSADHIIVLWNTCGAAEEQVDNGTPTFTCTGNGTALPNCTCSDLIANGDFEAGQDGSWTEFSSNNYDLVVTGAPTTSGTWSTWLGGANDETSIISQSISIDAGATTADLTFNFAYVSNEAAADCANDLFEIRFNGTVIGTQGLCPDANSATWIPAAIDLITFAGQSGLLEFEVITDAANTSSVYIDDVVLTECATPSSCPANYMAGNALGGTSPSGSDYESDGGIETTQIIAPGSTTDYDSAIEIWMYPGFHAQAGCEAMAFIDGCNGSGGVVMLADGNYYEVENTSAKSATKYNRKIVAKNSAITNGCKDCIDLIYSNLSAFPNPTNDMTTISFTGAGSKASVEIFDIQGKLVKAIFNGNTSANVTQQVSINTNDLAKGIYVVKLAQTNQKDDFLKLIVK